MASTKSKFTDPSRGTKISLLLELLLREQGCTIAEALEIGALGREKSMNCAIDRLGFDCGYDIRTFPKDPNRLSPKGRASAVYKCVGRSEWDGGYQDFIAPLFADEAGA